MLELYFSVRAETLPGDSVYIAGSSPDLGLWDPKRGLPLTYQSGVWEGTLLNVRQGVKLQFKIIKYNGDGKVDWEPLPDNANRKFRPKLSMQLHLRWGEASGKINSIVKNSFKLMGLPAVMIKGKPSKMMSRQSEEFDPYLRAHEQSDQQNEEQFKLVKKKMSDYISMNHHDLEQIYYKNSSVQIISELQKKEKVYVISNSLELPPQLQAKIQEQMSRLSGAYMARWITADCLRGDKKSGSEVKFRKSGSLFNVCSEQVCFQSLYSKTSYLIVVEVEVALLIEKMLGKVSCCLYVPSQQYSKVIQNLPKLSKVDLICFDTTQANKAFYEHLIQNSNTEIANLDKEIDFLELEHLSIELIVQELEKLKWRTTGILDTIQSIQSKELLSIVSQPNSLTILDAEAAKEVCEDLCKKDQFLISVRSMIVVVCEEDIPESIVNCNWVFIYQNFQKIKIKGKEYLPLRSFREVIQQIKLKSSIYQDVQGGQVVCKESSIVYTLPEEKEDFSAKVQAECRKVASKFDFVKVSRKGVRVKVSWSLSKEIRLIRTICQLKYISHGPLGPFNLISKQQCFRELKEEIKYITDSLPKMFEKGSDTAVEDFQFGEDEGSKRIIKGQ